jgi:hypothetical protein
MKSKIVLLSLWFCNVSGCIWESVDPRAYSFSFALTGNFVYVSTLFSLTNMSNWSCLSMFMDGRFLNMARIGFEIIMSEN